MSQPFVWSTRRYLRQSPVEFLRQCRVNACRTNEHSFTASNLTQRPYSRATKINSTRYLERPLPFDPSCRPTSASPMRSFSVTIAPRATTVIQNPRLDEDGNEMTIEISERAAKRLQQITSSPTPSISSQNTPQHNHLRVSVTSGGCHGFQYLMSLEPSTAIENDVDTVFAWQDAPDAPKVVMDEASLELLKGSTVDYTTELIGSQFKIVGNPRAKSSCGCGTSFDIAE